MHDSGQMLDTLPPLPSPQEMAAWDAAAIQTYGIREEMLMENASREALHVLTDHMGSIRGKTALLFMGSGNNGGDAAALARHMQDSGADVLVLHTKSLSHYRGVSGYHLRLAKRIGVPFLRLRPGMPETFPTALARFRSPDIAVDGLLGTGLSGSLREDMLGHIRAINALRPRAFILALDIPSGLNGTTGQPGPEAVRAHVTVTFAAAKTGLAMPGASAHTGTLVIRPIGIPAAVHSLLPASCRMLDTGVAQTLPLPTPAMHKGSSGHTVIIGGATGMSGAAILAAHGAARGGSGYVTIAAPATQLPLMATGNPQFMTHTLGETTWPAAHTPALKAILEKADAIVIGPGMGRDAAAEALLHTLLSQTQRPPMVLDADALYHLSRNRELLALLTPDDMLTPHPGEMALLAQTTTALVQEDRLAMARAFALQYPCVLVLKGAGTLIVHGGKPAIVSPFAVPVLAVAGSGDVLAGLAGSLLAQHVSTFPAACLAVYLHAQAGLHLQATDFPLRGNTALEIAQALTLAKKELASCLPQKI